MWTTCLPSSTVQVLRTVGQVHAESHFGRIPLQLPRYGALVDPYKRYPNPNGVDVERPVIPIVLRNPRAPLSPAIGHEALVDSGSDHCIFSSEIGEVRHLEYLFQQRPP